MVDDGLVPTSNVGVLRPPFLVEEELETTSDKGDGEEIGKSEALANEVGVDEEVVLEDLEGLQGTRLAVLNRLLV